MYFKIRGMKDSDIDRIIDIERESFEYNYPPSLIMQIYTSFPEGFLVVEEASSKKIIGYIMGIIEWGNGHIVSIAVDRAYRNRGIGTMLLNALEYILFKKYNVNNIVLEVRFDNNIARKFYYNKGYEDRRLLKNYYDDGSDAILMVKKNPYMPSKNSPIIVNMW